MLCLGRFYKFRYIFASPTLVRETNWPFLTLFTDRKMETKKEGKGF